MMRLTITTIIIFIVFFNTPGECQSSEDLSLWYDKPAEDWMTEALPIGNGYMGPMFFGGVEIEQL